MTSHPVRAWEIEFCETKEITFNTAFALDGFNIHDVYSLTYVLNVAFVALYHINEIRRRAGEMMSYTSLFFNRSREKSVRRGSLCNGRTPFAPISVTTESYRGDSGWWGGGGVGGRLPVVFGPDQYMSRRFFQRRFDIRGGEENAARHRCEKRKMLRLLEIT